jgi:hypothetical protein
MGRIILDNKLFFSIMSGVIVLLCSVAGYMLALDHSHLTDADKACAAEYKQLNPRVTKLEDRYEYIGKQLERMSKRQDIIIRLLNERTKR